MALLIPVAAGLAASLAACPIPPDDPGFDAAAYLEAAGREELRAMIGCLGSPDPVIRDERALGAFVEVLRADRIEPDRRGDLMDMLAEAIVDAEHDEAGFIQPFAALALAEVARTDRIKPWLDVDELRRLVQFAGFYLTDVTDYRGFTDGEGWRHGIAHGADLMMQLALNPRTDREMAEAILDAIASQIAPDAHAYRFGEPARLARPVLFLAERGVVGQSYWAAWFASLARGVDADGPDQPVSEADLTRIHNLRAFALEIHAVASRQPDGTMGRLAPLALELLSATSG